MNSKPVSQTERTPGSLDQDCSTLFGIWINKKEWLRDQNGQRVRTSRAMCEWYVQSFKARGYSKPIEIFPCKA